MKTYKFLFSALAASLLLGSCSLESESYVQKKDTEAYQALSDVKAGVTGAYYYVGSAALLGNYALSISDMCGGVSAGSPSTGHLYNFSSYTYTDQVVELRDMWDAGYKAVGAATATVNGAKQLMASGAIKEADYPAAYSYISQSYAIKALVNFYLVNYFGKTYSEANKTTPGIVVYDTEIPLPGQQVARATVEESYQRIVNDLDSATVYNERAGESAEASVYYLGRVGIEALKARVYLFMGNYDKAGEAAKLALQLKKGTGDASDVVPGDEDYLAMWGETKPTAEDLFAIVKSADDNLSSNSLNTLYGSYQSTIQDVVEAAMGEQDIRRKIFSQNKGGRNTLKFIGKTDPGVSNIPVFRKSEMSLIIAEVEARKGNIDAAKNYLMFTARRDKAITSVDQLPGTTDELLQFIANERLKEFFGEGIRLFDARRLGIAIKMDKFNDWNPSNFVFPIPINEINAGFGVQQNEGWHENLPTEKQ